MKLDTYRFVTAGSTAGALVMALGNAVAAPYDDADLLPLVPFRTEFARIQLASGTNQINSYDIPSAVGLGAEAQAAIGAEGVQRIISLGRISANWDGCGAKVLNRDSVRALSRFFQDHPIDAQDAAVFMSFSGNLILSWENPQGQVVEVEFASDRLHLFVEASGVEEWMAYEQVDHSEVFDNIHESTA